MQTQSELPQAAYAKMEPGGVVAPGGEDNHYYHSSSANKGIGTHQKREHSQRKNRSRAGTDVGLTMINSAHAQGGSVKNRALSGVT